MALFDPSGGGRRRQPIGKTFLTRVHRGQTIVSAWPSKRGAAFHKKNKPRSTFFANVQRLFLYLPSWEREVYREMAKEGPFLPRDFWTMNSYGRFLAIEDPGGMATYPERALFDVSKSLDVTGQEVGSVMVRGEKYWQAVAGETEGHILVSRGPGLPPVWLPNTGASGGEGYFSPPAVEDFALAAPVTQATIANADRGGIVISRKFPTPVHAILIKPATTAITAAETAVELFQVPEGLQWGGVCLYDTSTTRMMRLAVYCSHSQTLPYIRFERYAHTGSGGWIGSVFDSEYRMTGIPVLRIEKDGDIFTALAGPDPKAMTPLAQVEDTALGADLDAVGITQAISAPTDYIVGTRFRHFKAEY